MEAFELIPDSVETACRWLRILEGGRPFTFIDWSGVASPAAQFQSIEADPQRLRIIVEGGPNVVVCDITPSPSHEPEPSKALPKTGTWMCFDLNALTVVLKKDDKVARMYLIASYPPGDINLPGLLTELDWPGLVRRHMEAMLHFVHLPEAVREVVRSYLRAYAQRDLYGPAVSLLRRLVSYASDPGGRLQITPDGSIRVPNSSEGVYGDINTVTLEAGQPVTCNCPESGNDIHLPGRVCPDMIEAEMAIAGGVQLKLVP